MLGGRLGIGSGLVDQLEHVLRLDRGSAGRHELPRFQVLEAERSSEFRPSHSDLPVYRLTTRALAPGRCRRSPSHSSEIRANDLSDFKKNSVWDRGRIGFDGGRKSKSRARERKRLRAVENAWPNHDLGRAYDS